MAAKKPDLVIIDGALPATKTPTRRRQPPTSVMTLDAAMSAAPALMELTQLLPHDKPYTPLIRAAVAALKAYLDRQANGEREKQIAAIKKTWSQFARLPADDKRRAALQLKLDRAINQL